mgnify:CR=1 FL=1
MRHFTTERNVLLNFSVQQSQDILDVCLYERVYRYHTYSNFFLEKKLNKISSTIILQVKTSSKYIIMTFNYEQLRQTLCTKYIGCMDRNDKGYYMYAKELDNLEAEYLTYLMEEIRQKKKTKLEDISPMVRKLHTTSFKKKCMVHDEPKEVVDLIENFKIIELKEKVSKNYTDISKMKGNKSWKKTWAKQLLETHKWGFNTFVVGNKSDKSQELYGQMDILLTIQKFM